MTTYSTIRDAKQSEEHILVTSWCDLGHHRLRIRIIWSLEWTEQDIVDPEISHVMVPHFLSPEAEHPVEGNEHGEEVSHHKHMFRLEPKILLNVPKPER